MATRNIETNLLASIAVFAELCNTKTDIRSIINEFIKSVYALEKSFALDSHTVMALLKKHFDFDIPEAVVKNCLNSLKSNKFLSKENGQYIVIDKKHDATDFLERLNLKRNDQLLIETKLIDYYESFKKRKVNEKIKRELIENFISYLIDNGVTDEYSTIISSFVVENSQTPDFVSSLNQIKEGVIYVTGLKYTNDLTNLGKWDDELTIYLDTEILFNSAGFNGIVYQKLFNDFYGLIREINQLSQKKDQKKKIHLKYFTQTKKDIDDFFYKAIRIIKREDNTTPITAAMVEICNGCSTVNDIIRKKSAFETSLKSMGITQQADLDYYSNPEFIIETSELFDKYKVKFDESILINVLHSFTQVNFHRKGINRTSFEKCKHIILTGKSSSMRLSKDIEIKNEARDIPFSTDIYFITNRFWFKLNKGLSKSKEIPSTLDIVAKAQVVLASQINKSVENRFHKLKNESKLGKLTKEQAQDYYHNLREEAKKPEEINNQSIKETIEIIFEDNYETYLREKSLTKIKVDEGEAAIRELRKLKSEKHISIKKPIKRKYKRLYLAFVSIFLITILMYFSLCIFLLIKSLGQSDTIFSSISGFFTILPVLIGIIKMKWILQLNIFIRNKLKAKYYRALQAKLKNE